jgi:hypothetical protein
VGNVFVCGDREMNVCVCVCVCVCVGGRGSKTKKGGIDF